jgi:hypothetical protein
MLIRKAADVSLAGKLLIIKSPIQVKTSAAGTKRVLPGTMAAD